MRGSISEVCAAEGRARQEPQTPLASVNQDRGAQRPQEAQQLCHTRRVNTA